MKSSVPLVPREKSARTLSAVDNRGGWWGMIKESFTGAWQKNVEVKVDTVLTYSAVFRCISLISSDVAKMRIRLVEMDANGIWTEADSPAFSPVLRKPNRWQNRIQFYANWVESKLIHGNAYILKERDNRGVVAAIYVLDPNRVKPLVAEDGSVYYEMGRDPLGGVVQASVTVPASEIIHDRWNTIYHPLIGTSPIHACGLAAVQGLKIQTNSVRFFGNGSNPGGVLTAPGAISKENAERLKAHWEANYSGENVGRTAVLGDGLKYETMAVKATDAQLIEQLKWSAETVCSTFGVPAYMAGVGAAPLNNNVEALGQQYYSQCLQILIESIELCLDEGLGLTAAKDGRKYGTEFDLDDLLRMDTATLIVAEAAAVGGGIKAPDESRKRLGLKPVAGGDTPYMQQQNYSLAALARRDAQADPFASAATAAPAVEDTPPEAPANDNAEAEARAALVEIYKGLR
ncbi:phage portal protein [Metarhizobium album]|uniref:Phage portal protein n=1 Tax=Metarhizobium album TaxID=2182425 RepID=A0A2U2DWH3_9HYPH|nr:phage portal protein [Rhizobium album]PWE57656.1 phage portal protein [Rhizobium album]